jgi:hypothetical protein
VTHYSARPKCIHLTYRTGLQAALCGSTPVSARQPAIERVVGSTSKIGNGGKQQGFWERIIRMKLTLPRDVVLKAKNSATRQGRIQWQNSRVRGTGAPHAYNKLGKKCTCIDTCVDLPVIDLAYRILLFRVGGA